MTDEWTAFIKLWGSRPRRGMTATALLPLAEAAGIKLAGANIHGRLTSLGMLLSRREGKAIKIGEAYVSLRRRQAPYCGRTIWALLSCEVHYRG